MSSELLRRDAIFLFVADILLGLYIIFKNGFNSRFAILLGINLLVLGIIISLCDSNPKAAGIVGIFYVLIALFAGGSIIFTILGILMLIRSIRTIMEN